MLSDEVGLVDTLGHFFFKFLTVLIKQTFKCQERALGPQAGHLVPRRIESHGEIGTRGIQHRVLGLMIVQQQG